MILFWLCLFSCLNFSIRLKDGCGNSVHDDCDKTVVCQSSIHKIDVTFETFFYSLLFLIHTQFIGVKAQLQENDDNGNLCHLDDLFPLILSILYAATSLLTLFGVSYWSFKSMTGTYTYVQLIYMHMFNNTITTCGLSRTPITTDEIVRDFATR